VAVVARMRGGPSFYHDGLVRAGSYGRCGGGFVFVRGFGHRLPVEGVRPSSELRLSGGGTVGFSLCVSRHSSQVWRYM